MFEAAMRQALASLQARVAALETQSKGGLAAAPEEELRGASDPEPTMEAGCSAPGQDEPDNATRAERTSFHLNHISLYEAQYKFKESVWDVSIFTGMHGLGGWVNALLALSLVLNVGIQLSLCAIVTTELSSDPYSEGFLEELRMWRQQVSDSVAESICTEDWSLATDTMQAQIYAEARDFMSPGGKLQSAPTGPVVAVVVIFMWTLTVCENLRSAWEFLMATWRLHNKFGNSAEFKIDMLPNKDYFEITGMTCFRTIWAVFVGVLQMFIATCLLFSGSFWLAYTKTIPDLLANAVALSYVMEVDELLYKVMVPSKGKTLLSHLKGVGVDDSSKSTSERTSIVPSKVKELVSHLKRVDFPKRAMCTACVAFIFVGSVVGAAVVPHASRLRRLRDDICPQ